MGKTLSVCIVKIIEIFIFVYDIVTFVPYYLVQRPHKVLQISRRTKAKPLIENDTTSPFRSLESFSKLRETPREGIRNLCDLFHESITRHRNLPSLGTREIIKEVEEKDGDGKKVKKLLLGEYKWQTYDQIERRVSSFSAGLTHLVAEGKAGVDKKVCIFCETRAEWLISMFACFKARYPVVTLFSTLGDDGLLHAIQETEVDTIIVSADLLKKLLELIQQLPKVKYIITTTPFLPKDEIKNEKGGKDEKDGKDEKGGKEERIKITVPAKVSVNSMKTLEIFGEKLIDKNILEPFPVIKGESIAFIMYTSGSTGIPKGVLLSHKNVLCAISGQGERVGKISSNDMYIGYLPLAHILEVTAEICCFLNGVPIAFSSPATIFDKSPKIKKNSKGDISEIQPTLMMAVPLIMDRLYKLIWEYINQSSNLKKLLFISAYQYKKKYFEAGYSTPFYDRLVFHKIRNALGGKVRLMLTGGAPLSPETQRFINICFCCPILQGYGLTETCGAGTVTEGSDRNTGRVGAPLQNNDIMLVNWEEGKYYNTDTPFPRGEIYIGGKNVAVGYFKIEDDSFKMINGLPYFASGDIGMIEPDGVLRIIDRKKDLIKLAAGEYIALAKVETQLKLCPLVDNLCVYADSTRTYTVCLVVPNRKNLENLANDLNITIGWPFICEDQVLIKAVLSALQEQGVQSNLAKWEIPRQLTMVPDVWTPDNGLITPAFKLRRKNIETHYIADIVKMYK